MSISIMNRNAYIEYIEFKSDLIKYLVTNIYSYHKKHFDVGNLVFIGSLLHIKLGIHHNNYINDIDISVNDGIIGDEIIKNLNYFFRELDLTYYKNIYNQKYSQYFDKENFNKLLYVDIFKAIHPSTCDSFIEIYPNVYTKYFGAEWNIIRICDYYYSLNIIENEIKRNKGKNKTKGILKNYLTIVNVNQFENIETYNKVMKIINE